MNGKFGGVARPGTKPMIDERRFIPETRDQAFSLYAAMLDAGTKPSTARIVIGWLQTLGETRMDDPAANSARRDYRQVLLKVGTPPWEVTGAYNSSGSLAA
jgi:hypothetical protein